MNGNGHNNNRNRRRKRKQHFNDDSNSSGESQPSTSLQNNNDWNMESHIPGFSYDPKTKKYYKILKDAPEHHNMATASGLRRQQVEEERLRKKEEEQRMKPMMKVSMLDSLMQRQLGFSDRRLQRRVHETRLQNVVNKENIDSQGDMIYDRHGGMTPKRCQFLEVTEDGRNLVCSWRVGRNGQQAATNPSLVGLLSPRCRDAEKESLTFSNEELHTTFIEGNVSSDFKVVGFQDESCLMYVEQNELQDGSRGVASSLKLRTIASLAETSNPSQKIGLDIPIFDCHDPNEKLISQLALHSGRSRLAIAIDGRFQHAMVTDLSDSTLEHYVFFKHNNVFDKNPIFALDFDKSGNIVYVGSKKRGLEAHDLRSAAVNRPCGVYGSKAPIFWIYTLQKTDNEVLSRGWDGEMKLWDGRNCKSAVHTYKSHMDTYFSIPTYVDHDERFLFAAARDGMVSGWALQSGKKLFDLACPWSVENVKTDIPNVVYAENWGGRQHSALVMASKSQFNSFEVPLHVD
ncbi:hypothetical protein L596_023994 [Steinernema carpocapsae]|uniref:Uncharacterized protein n=1 Tax=Steinernema carpocapsae TaxID=34508 RepID=A0A4U5MFK6_STECR|nr:hypothetical protein L596_023994 [Steinernema carpocapsae]